ncbi:MAG: acylglycerol kinase family protein, partial [Bacteroidota bacterium]|nr:acylglycerol kinase family protein [Bacteroidota bacterium]
MKKKFLFIINPTAGNGRSARSIPKIKGAIDNLHAKSPEIKGEVITTQYKNHATELVRAYQNNYERIIVVGGDGTLNEAINGLDPASETIMGVIPEGSGNDFAKMIGMKQDID